VNISAATVVTKSIIEPGTYSGAYPFERNAEWREHAVWLRNIDKLVERIKSLEQQLKVESARGSKS
jgi:UDP-3-O-[3-hydroxymyristoyl] glucosamine N-acyltransferase